jgi:hypothetical protein
MILDKENNIIDILKGLVVRREASKPSNHTSSFYIKNR